MPVINELYYYYYYQSGENESLPLVLIHGAGGNHLYWPSEIRRLAGYRIFALDLPGHGKSGGRGLQSIEAYTQYILNWLEMLGIHRAVFIGHSMGSAIALIIALDHPEHVLGLGLVGAGARLRVDPELLAHSASPTTYHKAVERLVSSFFSPSADPRLVELAALRMSEIRPSVLNGDLLACNAFDVTERVSKISQPTLVLSGADDQLTPVRYAQSLAGNIPSARLEVIPEAGHMVMLEKPQEVAGSLARFLPTLLYRPGEEG